MNGKKFLLSGFIFITSFIFVLTGCNSSEPLISETTESSQMQNSTPESSLNDSYESSEQEESEDVMAEYTRITAKEAYEMMNEKEVIILDVRTQSEYEQGHIENSVLLPVDEIKTKANSVLPDKDAVILVYCRSGNRSFYASKDLLELGYKNVYDFGGIINWPYDIVS